MAKATVCSDSAVQGRVTDKLSRSSRRMKLLIEWFPSRAAGRARDLLGPRRNAPSAEGWTPFACKSALAVSPRLPGRRTRAPSPPAKHPWPRRPGRSEILRAPREGVLPTPASSARQSPLQFSELGQCGHLCRPRRCTVGIKGNRGPGIAQREHAAAARSRAARRLRLSQAETSFGSLAIWRS